MKKKIVKILFVLIVIVIAVFIIQNKPYESFMKGDEPKEEIISIITLEKILQRSDLNTFLAYYNGVAKVMNEVESSEVDFYVSYRAKVLAGFDISDLKISMNDETKIIVVSIPEIQINDVNVDAGTLDYMFVNDKANNNMVSKRGYDASIKDVTKESQKASSIFDLAEENAKNIVKALLTPFVEDLDEDYEIEFY